VLLDAGKSMARLKIEFEDIFVAPYFRSMCPNGGKNAVFGPLRFDILAHLEQVERQKGTGNHLF